MAALVDADIVCTTTSATEPFLAAAMVPAGAHLNAVGGSMPYLRELLPDCVPALSFFTDYRPSLEAQAGEVIDARAAGQVPADWQATDRRGDRGHAPRPHQRCATHDRSASRLRIWRPRTSLLHERPSASAASKLPGTNPVQTHSHSIVPGGFEV